MRKLLALVVSIAMIPITLPANATAACESAVKSGNKQCPASVSGPSYGSGSGTIGANGGDLAAAGAANAAFAGEVAGKCTKAEESCKKSCQGPEAKKCDVFASRAGMAGAEGAQAGEAGAGGSETQSAASGGGDAMGMIGPMLGALAAMMANKKKEEEPQDYGALRPDGSLDCSKADAYQFADCATHLQNTCNANMESGLCRSFRGVYCAGAAAPAVGGAPTVLPVTKPIASPTPAPGLVNSGSGVAIQAAAMYAPPPMQPGMGSSSGFCQMVAYYDYCSQGGRDNCPSCLQLQQMKGSPACAQNPAACIQMNSPDVIAKAPAMCGGDPIVVANKGTSSGTIPVGAIAGGNPGQVAISLPGNNGTPVVGGGGAGAPAVVLPQTAAGRAAQLGMKTASANQGAVREGAAPGVAGNADGSSNSASGSSYSAQSAGSARGAGREVAGVLPASKTQAGPAPDVQGQFGPSVFAMGSQAIRNRCAAGKFLNCP